MESHIQFSGMPTRYLEGPFTRSDFKDRCLVLRIGRRRSDGPISRFRFLSAPFIFQEECRMKIEHVLFLSVVSTLRIHVSEGHFYCVHTSRFSESTNIGSLKSDGVKGLLH